MVHATSIIASPTARLLITACYLQPTPSVTDSANHHRPYNHQELNLEHRKSQHQGHGKPHDKPN